MYATKQEIFDEFVKINLFFYKNLYSDFKE